MITYVYELLNVCSTEKLTSYGQGT